MNRLVNTVVSVCTALGLTAPLQGSAPGGPLVLPDPAPFIMPLDLRPVANGYATASAAIKPVMPTIVRQGTATTPDPRQIDVPAVLPPVPPAKADPMAAIVKAGTGFFVGADGSLLTAAHVAAGCGRMQVVSRSVPRSWASLVAADPERDLALLRTIDYRPTAVARIAGSGPSSAKLLIIGYPETAALTAATETWAVPENQKFPAGAGALADPREMLWISAPAVTHGFSGGPIFDPKLGAVVGMVKGAVDAGYLRLVRDIPTVGMAIGPGVGQIGPFLKRDTPSPAMALAASTGETWLDTARRATVHVLCWR